MEFEFFHYFNKKIFLLSTYTHHYVHRCWIHPKSSRSCEPGSHGHLDIVVINNIQVPIVFVRERLPLGVRRPTLPYRIFRGMIGALRRLE